MKKFTHITLRDPVDCHRVLELAKPFAPTEPLGEDKAYAWTGDDAFTSPSEADLSGPILQLNLTIRQKKIPGGRKRAEIARRLKQREIHGPVSRKEKAEIKQDVTEMLLAKAPVDIKQIPVWVCQGEPHALAGATTDSQLDTLLIWLRELGLHQVSTPRPGKWLIPGYEPKPDQDPTETLLTRMVEASADHKGQVFTRTVPVQGGCLFSALSPCTMGGPEEDLIVFREGAFTLTQEYKDARSQDRKVDSVCLALAEDGLPNVAVQVDTQLRISSWDSPDEKDILKDLKQEPDAQVQLMWDNRLKWALVLEGIA